MPPFRDWPVCWLFLLATATVDAALLSGSAVSPWAAGWVVGQMMVLGLWVVHGEMHRLLRGAIFVAGLGGLSWLVATVIEPFFLQRWFALLAATLAIQGAVAAAAAATAWASRNRQRGAGVAIDEPWQYPLIEIFGWTIIVAAARVLLRYAAMAGLVTADAWRRVERDACRAILRCRLPRLPLARRRRRPHRPNHAKKIDTGRRFTSGQGASGKDR